MKIFQKMPSISGIDLGSRLPLETHPNYVVYKKNDTPYYLSPSNGDASKIEVTATRAQLPPIFSGLFSLGECSFSVKKDLNEKFGISSPPPLRQERRSLTRPTWRLISTLVTHRSRALYRPRQPFLLMLARTVSSLHRHRHVRAIRVQY
jgi:hypothetical protein